MRKKIFLGTLLSGLILLGIYLYNLGARPDREYPTFTLHPEKKPQQFMTVSLYRMLCLLEIIGMGLLPFLIQILLKS